MAKEYIDREAALEALSNPLTMRALSMDELKGMRLAQEMDRVVIAHIPAADVVEVRHGHWVKARGSWITPGGDPVWECSECGKGRHVYGVEHDSYGSDVADGQWAVCPNCGVNMEEEA